MSLNGYITLDINYKITGGTREGPAGSASNHGPLKISKNSFLSFQDFYNFLHMASPS